MPFEFAIAVGVKRGETALRDALDAALQRRRLEIDSVLDDFGIPRTDRGTPP
jgi:mxaJ protein